MRHNCCSEHGCDGGCYDDGQRWRRRGIGRGTSSTGGTGATATTSSPQAAASSSASSTTASGAGNATEDEAAHLTLGADAFLHNATSPVSPPTPCLPVPRRPLPSTPFPKARPPLRRARCRRPRRSPCSEVKPPQTMGRKRDKGKQRKAKQSSHCPYASHYAKLDGCDLCHGVSVNQVPEDVVRFIRAYNTSFDKNNNGRSAFLQAKEENPDVWLDKSHRDVVRTLFVAQGVSSLLAGGERDVFLAVQNIPCIIFIEEKKARTFRDVLEGGDRALISFFRKRCPCSCLEKHWAKVKGKPRKGLCDGCGHRFERSRLKLCSGESFVLSFCDSSAFCERSHHVFLASPFSCRLFF